MIASKRRSIAEMIEEANAQVRTLAAAEALSWHGRDDIVFIDVRDVRELAQTGRIAGARHVPRGMLEFWIDPDSPYHKPFFAEDRTFVFYCASAWRSALAAKVAQEMGLLKVAHLAGGLAAWTELAGPMDAARKEGAPKPGQ